MNVAIFETQHFLVRPCTMADAGDIVGFWNDPEVMKYIGDGSWGGDMPVVKEFLQKTIVSYSKAPGYGDCSIVDKQSKKVVGLAGLELLAESHEVEAGYILCRQCWGRGFATEILNGLIRYGFSQLQCEKIMAISIPDNLASIRVMKKCGMHYVGRYLQYGLWHSKYLIDK
jgi:ribosomal-protein-alanine N-acetyltransferase